MEIESSVDNQATEASDTAQTSHVDTQAAHDASESGQTQPEQVETEKPYVPFSAGKEKFKVRGQEVEWDWNETKKWAQLNHSGYVAMEQAKAIEKKAQDTLQQLYKLANERPDDLIRTFNPNYNPQAARQQANAGQDGSETQDPTQAEIARLNKEIADLKGGVEQREVAEERALIQKEITSALDQYPVLKGVLKAEQLIKAEYARQLRLGNDQISIDDVAFHMAQEAQETEKKRVEAQKARLAQNRKAAPVSTSPSGGSGQSKGMTREDVRALAGLPPN